jgi:subtilase family serine protease
MKTTKDILKTALLVFLALAFLPAIAAAQQMKTLHYHVPAAISRLNLQPIGQLPADTNLALAISLPLQNEQVLGALLSQIYDPTSTNYHRYLKSGDFTTRFGPSVEDYQKVIDFAKSHGMTIVCTYSNRTLLDVSGKVSDIQNAFGLTLRTYHHPSENRDFYAPNTDPTVSTDLPVSHITGLDNYFIPHPLFVKKEISTSSYAPGAKPGLGSGPGGTYMGNDFRAAYVPGVGLNGGGQKIALFELDGYFNADILSYEQQAGLPNLTLTNISVDGGVPNPTFSGDPEVSLDIEMDISMATNASEIIVYEAPNGFQNSVVDELSRIAQDDLAAQISASWAIGDNSAFDVAYVQMAVQGQSFFLASGDNGAFYSNSDACWRDDPVHDGSSRYMVIGNSLELV